MNSQIICIEDITSINTDIFYKTFLSRLKAQNIKIRLLDLINFIFKFDKMMNLDKNFNFDSKDFSIKYLYTVYMFLSTLEDNTCYIIKHTPFLFNLFKYISSEKNNLLKDSAYKIMTNFTDLLKDILVYINIYSYTDKVKNILEDKMYYQKYIYDNMIKDYSNNTQKIDAVEKLKLLLLKNIALFRKQGIISIKVPFNFNEDVHSGIDKIFNTLNIQ